MGERETRRRVVVVDAAEVPLLEVGTVSEFEEDEGSPTATAAERARGNLLAGFWVHQISYDQCGPSREDHLDKASEGGQGRTLATSPLSVVAADLVAFRGGGLLCDELGGVGICLSAGLALL